MRYGIFGGTFDPPHNGHIAVAHAVKEQLRLESVMFIPNNRNPLKRKQSLATPQQRLEMVNLAVTGEEGLWVSDIEVSRPGRSFTVDTLDELVLVQPGERWLILGSDALKGIMEWKSPERIVRMCRIAVVHRPGSDIDKVIGMLPEWMQESIDKIEMKPNRASSTLVREEILRGESPEIWLNPKVWEYISERGLYSK